MDMMNLGLKVKYVNVSPAWVNGLAELFEALIVNGDELNFHPHPLNLIMANEIAAYEGEDLYYLQVVKETVTGYAMLRGWDEGYKIPSLGIAIHPYHQGRGMAALFMDYLHYQAIQKGAQMVMLKVHSRNKKARNVYERMGYSFTSTVENQLVGYKEL
jgi:[ribosomal protein S18]-alanine N-acetyltransferase